MPTIVAIEGGCEVFLITREGWDRLLVLWVAL